MKQLLILAPNIPQVYIALELITALKKALPECSFLFSTRDKYLHLIEHLEQVQKVDIPSGLDFDLSAFNLDAILFTGHSYFLDTGTLSWLIKMKKPTFWVNAHFEKDDLISWNTDRNKGFQIVQLFETLFLDDLSDIPALKSIGFSNDQLILVGNAKYDCAFSTKEQITTAGKIIKALGKESNRIIVAGSVIDGDESEILVKAFTTLKSKFNDLFLILAPRSMDHVHSISKIIAANNINFALVSKPESWNEKLSILVIDEMGLLKGFYHWATMVFMGRSLLQGSGSGSNIIEPAAQEAPIIVGPYLSNFAATLDDFLKEQAILKLSNAGELLAEMEFLLNNSNKAKAMGKRAQQVVKNNCGALTKSAEMIANFLNTTN